MNFKSLPELLDYFKKEETCIKYYETIRWNGTPACPHCGALKPYKTNRGFKCSDKECHKKFTVKVGTIFENSKIPFRIWFAAIYLCTAHKKGISSVQLATDLNITQKTAWFVLHRVREMLKKQAPQMLGETNVVEADEAYVGGLEANKHTKKRRSDLNPDFRNDGTPYKRKKIVLGIVERGGKVILKHIPAAKEQHMVAAIRACLPEGKHIVTDEHHAYGSLNKFYTHETVNHSLKIYVEGKKHTNTIENFWSTLKRCVNGTFHHISDKHLERYLNEFAARYNSRELSSCDRFEKFLSDSEGGLLYKVLIAND